MAETVVDPLAEYRSGSTEPWVADLIGAIVRAKGPKLALETGTFEGKTTRVIAANMNAGTELVTVEHDIERATSAGRDLHDPKINLVCASATDFIRNWDGPPFDLVFLDDDHDATHVAEELDLLYDPTRSWQRVSPGGLILVHDVIGPFGLGPIVRARHGFLLDLPRLHTAGGLGLIQVPV